MPTSKTQATRSLFSRFIDSLRNHPRLVLITLLVPPFFTLFYNCIRVSLGYQTLDSAIYQQAILDLAFTPHWNPFNTVRGLRIFSDHFDPIILLAAAIQRVLGTTNWIPHILEFLFYWGGGIFIYWITRKKRTLWRIFAISFWLFSDGILEGIRYSLHPTTWSVLPILLLAWALKRSNFTAALLIGNILCCFKEYFPFCLFNLGMLLFFSARTRRVSFGFIVTSLSWIIFDFYLRPKLFDGFHDHGRILLNGIQDAPLQFILLKFTKIDWKGIVFSAFPTVLTFFIVYIQEQNRKWIHHLMAFIAPVFMIQFLHGNFGIHYGAPMHASLLSVIAVSDGKWLGDFKAIKKPIQVFIWITLFYVGADSILRTRQAISMIREDDKKAAISKVRSILDFEPQETKIVSSIGIISSVIKPNQKIYPFTDYSEKQPFYDIIIVGNCKRFYDWPYQCEDHQRIIQNCRSFATEIWTDDSLLFFARGKFPRSCIDP